jgi:hypothetical protein
MAHNHFLFPDHCNREKVNFWLIKDRCLNLKKNQTLRLNIMFGFHRTLFQVSKIQCEYHIKMVRFRQKKIPGKKQGR